MDRNGQKNRKLLTSGEMINKAAQLDEEIISTELPWDLSWQRYSMQFILFFFNYDYFSIYKGTHRGKSRARYQRYLVPELRMELNYWDDWRKPWKLYYTIVYVIYAIRFVLICVIQFLVYEANAARSQASRLGENRQLEGECENFYICAEELLRDTKLLTVFYNILIDHPGISLIFHISLLASSTNIIYRTHFKYTREPFDSSFLRLAVEPNREIRRVKLAIREQIVAQLASNKQYVQNLSQSRLDSVRHIEWRHSMAGRRYYNSAMAHRHADLLAEPNSSHGEPLKALNWSPSSFDVTDLVPRRYSADGFRRFWLLARKVTVLVIVWASLFAYNVQTYIIFSIRDVRCKECSVMEVLSWLDLWSITEELIVNVSVGSIVTHQMISIIMHLLSQLDLTNELKYHLIDLLNALRLINDTSIGGHSTTPCRVVTNRHLNPRSRYLNDALLKTLVKLRFSLDDYCDLNANISEQVSSIIVAFGSILILTLTAGRIEGNDIEVMRNYVTKISWFGTNALVAMCAYVFTEMGHLVPIIWSVIAQLKLLSARHTNLTQSNELGCLIRSWHNLALNLNAFEEGNSVRPFGIGLTYKMALRMNFFIATIATLVAH